MKKLSKVVLKVFVIIICIILWVIWSDVAMKWGRKLEKFLWYRWSFSRYLAEKVSMTVEFALEFFVPVFLFAGYLKYRSRKGEKYAEKTSGSDLDRQP